MKPKNLAETTAVAHENPIDEETVLETTDKTRGNETRNSCRCQTQLNELLIHQQEKLNLLFLNSFYVVGAFAAC